MRAPPARASPSGSPACPAGALRLLGWSANRRRWCSGTAGPGRSSPAGFQGPRLRLGAGGGPPQPARAAAGLPLPATVVFDHANPRALAEFLEGELADRGPGGVAAVAAELDRLEARPPGCQSRAGRAGPARAAAAGLGRAAGRGDAGNASHAAPAPPAAGLAQECSNSSTAEDMFDLLDGELGSSGTGEGFRWLSEAKLRDYLKRATAELHQTRQRLREVEAAGRGAGRDRRRWAAGTPAACASPEDCGGWWPTAATRSAAFPADRGWDLGALYDPDPDQPGHQLRRARAASSHDAGEFDAGFFGISPARGAGHGPAAAAAAGDRLGGARARRHRPARAARQRDRRVRRRLRQDYGSRLPAPRRTCEGYLADRQRRQRRLRPGRLHLRPGGPGGHRRHRLLLLAGRAAPGRAGAARAASARWRWPAASR